MALFLDAPCTTHCIFHHKIAKQATFIHQNFSFNFRPRVFLLKLSDFQTQNFEIDFYGKDSPLYFPSSSVLWPPLHGKLLSHPAHDFSAKKVRALGVVASSVVLLIWPSKWFWEAQQVCCQKQKRNFIVIHIKVIYKSLTLFENPPRPI